jgi:polysaccharide biosynthesis protein PslE
MTNEPNRHPRRHVFGPRELAAAYFRHKKKAAFFTLLVFALAIGVIVYGPRKYRSEGRLFLQVGRESIRLDPTATTGKTIALQQSNRDNEIATAIEVLKSRAIVEAVVDRLTPEVVLAETDAGDAEPNPVAEKLLAPIRYVAGAVKSIDPISKREEAVIAIMENMWVEAEFDSSLIAATYETKSPRLAKRVLSTILDVYREEHARLHRTSGSKPFFTKQRDELETQLTNDENKLRAAKNRMGVGSIDSRRTTLETRLSSVELSRNRTIQQVAAAEASIAALESRLETIPERLHTSTTTVPNTGADALRSQLYGLQVQLMNLEAKYTPDHPRVAAAQAQVKEAQQMIKDEAASREEVVDSLNENHRALALELEKTESQLAGLQAQLTELDQQRVETLKDLRQLNDFEVELDELDRAVTLSRKNFFHYAEALEQARMDQELDNQRISNINVAQEPTLAEKPVSPSKPIVAALALMLATAGVTALVLISEKFDSRLRTEEQVEQTLQIPVLAAVPEGRIYGGIPSVNG